MQKQFSSGREGPNLCSHNLEHGFLEQAPQVWERPPIWFHLVQKQQFGMVSENMIRDLYQ